MNEHELKCSEQRILARTGNHTDARAILDELKRLRNVLREIRDMTGDPAIIAVCDEELAGK